MILCVDTFGLTFAFAGPTSRTFRGIDVDAEEAMLGHSTQDGAHGADGVTPLSPVHKRPYAYADEQQQRRNQQESCLVA